MQSFQLERFGQPFAKRRSEAPAPRDAQAVVQITASGVCHSDVHLWDGFFDLGEGRRLEAQTIVSPPRTLGHEIAGTVVAVGPGVTVVAPGDRCVVYPWIGCGSCEACRGGDEQLCRRPEALGVQRDGGFAELVLVPHERYLIPYDPLPDVQACTYACSGLTAYAALRKVMPPVAGERLLVVGAGGVGLSAIRLAKAFYGVEPIVAEIDRGKWDIARDAGASDVVDPQDPHGLRSIARGGVAAAIDFVGSGSSFEFALGALRKGGRLVCVGLFGGSARVVPSMLAMRAVSVAGSYAGSLDDLRRLLALARSRPLPELLVEERPLEEASAAILDLKRGRVRGRVVLRPNGKVETSVEAR